MNNTLDVEISIVDYGLGNLRSVTRGLERAGADVSLISSPGEITRADALVLPGVGAFREGMDESRDLHDALQNASSDTPILGICLGMQMMMSVSEEGVESGVVEGLDLISGSVKRFPGEVGKVPHMGWNTLDLRDSTHPIVEGIDDSVYVYFVHSYYASESEREVCSTSYGDPDGEMVRFSSVVSNREGNVVGTQFHPEKSGDVGLKLLENFVEFASSN